MQQLRERFHVSMSVKRDRRRPLAEINVVPYIDVMLVLLVIFMITAPLLSQGVNVDLPKVAAKTLAKDKEPIIVSVDEQGRYFLNIASNPQAPLDAAELASRVTQELNNQDNAKRPVMVKGDRRVDYGKVVQVMVLLQQAGADSVGLITEPIATKAES